MKRCIYCVSDSGYFEKFKIFFRSLRKYNYCDDVRILLINPTDNEISWVEKHNVKYEVKEKKFEKVEDMKGYCANIRGTFIRKTINQYDVVAYFDVDSIVRRDFESFFNFYRKGFDLQVLKRNSGSNLQKMFAVGVIGISVNETTLKFVDLWIEKISEEGLHNWFSDQIGFARAYIDLESELKFRKLEMSYIDWGFHPFSKIWVGKGERKNEVRVYKAQETVLLEKPFSFKYILSQIFLLKYIVIFFLNRIKLKLHRKLFS